MKSIPILKTIILTLTICGISFKTWAQQLASQKPLSSFYNEKVQQRVEANGKNNPHYFSPLQTQRNLPSVKPLPKQATGSHVRNAGIVPYAGLPGNDKIKKLPSKSALTVNQIASRKPARQKPL